MRGGGGGADGRGLDNTGGLGGSGSGALVRHKHKLALYSVALALLPATLLLAGAATAQETCHGVSDAVWCQLLLNQDSVGFCNTPYVPTTKPCYPSTEGELCLFFFSCIASPPVCRRR